MVAVVAKRPFSSLLPFHTKASKIDTFAPGCHLSAMAFSPSHSIDKIVATPDKEDDVSVTTIKASNVQEGHRHLVSLSCSVLFRFAGASANTPKRDANMSLRKILRAGRSGVPSSRLCRCFRRVWSPLVLDKRPCSCSLLTSLSSR